MHVCVTIIIIRIMTWSKNMIAATSIVHHKSSWLIPSITLVDDDT